MLGFFYHLLFPRESNNHRAKILHHQGLLSLIAILLVVQFVISFAGKTGVLGTASDISISDLLAKTNQVRAENGLPPLSMNSELASAATAKGQDMLMHNYWAHNSPQGLTPWVFIKGANYNYLYAGENLARGFSNAGDVMNAWMASPGHRENIMSPHYKDIGFAVMSGSLTGEDTILVVEEFGSKNTLVADTTSQTLSLPSEAPRVAGIQVVPPTSIPVQITPVVVANQQTGITPSPITHRTNLVAGSALEPLTNKRSVTMPIALGILGLLLGVLIADIVIIERKKIVRLVSHNVDHIIYLTIVIIIIVIVGRGITL